MKTTVDLPDELVIEAKKFAAEQRTTLRDLVENGLRQEIHPRAQQARKRSKPKIRWVIDKGGLAPGLDVSDRDKMYAWFEENDRD
ncbi:MAG: hypothetical protein MUC42_12610 [Bryobacter sp.]|nr:hypothetical protein [Bryobacter sp.]